MKILNTIIEPCDLAILKNERIMNLNVINWGKAVASSNEYIQKSLLSHMLGTSYDVSVNSRGNNGDGYDLLINKKIRIQSKLRQVNGLNAYSKGLHFETTRRFSRKNWSKCETGHCCYSSNEFDFVLISLIHSSIDRSEVDDWVFVLIPSYELIDKGNDLKTTIDRRLLEKYEIKNKDDILKILV